MSVIVTSGSTKAWRFLTECGVLAICMAATPAIAQVSPAAPPSGEAVPQPAAGPNTIAQEVDADPAQEIVVTGTLLRGVAPTGTNVVSVSAADVIASGATTANQVLARVPQIANAFNTVTALPSQGASVSVVRPNLRNLPAVGGSTTLLLIDGHRAVNAGILQTSPDPDVIPPSLLQRVDVVPDGGSSIYGSDAVGGVINFVTRSRFDGIEASGRYGFADDYQSVDASLTVGKDWGSGSLFGAYSYLKSDAIFGRDRDYVQQIQPNAGFCAPGTVNVTRASVTTTYALPGRTPGTLSSCDNTDNASIVPAVERHSVFAGLTQELSPAITFEAKAFYTRRTTDNSVDFNSPEGVTPLAQTVTIRSTNPFYVPIATDPGTQSVTLSYAGIFPNRQRNRLDEWGVTPTLSAELGSGWQLRLLGNYGRSVITANAPAINTAAQSAAAAGTTTATALNPYNLGATNPSVLAAIRAEDYGRAVQELFNGRAVLDGALFSMPGGDVRLAVGYEYIGENYSGAFGVIPVGQPSAAARGAASRNVNAVFGELAVPIVGNSNAIAGVQALTLSASGRYDHYSDFGDTFNPKFGLTYKPVTWITIRGNYGTSFNAPSLADSAGAPDSRAQILPVSPFRPSTSPFFPNFLRPTVLIAGGNPNLGPQKATTWSVGGDIRPTGLPGLTLSGTYYNIRLKDQIALAEFFSPAIFAPAYANYVTLNPTLAQVQAAVGNLRLDGASSLASLYGGPFGGPFALFDARRNNLGALRQEGIDYNANYNYDTGFGSIFAGVGGTYTLKRAISPVAGAAFVDDLTTPGASRFSLLGTLGTKIGGFNATATLRHSAGYDISPAVVSTRFGTQSRVSAFDVVDLFFAYDVKQEGILDGLSLTLNVNNVFDRDPPFYNLNNGFTNGSTLGRFVQFGVRKTF